MANFVEFGHLLDYTISRRNFVRGSVAAGGAAFLATNLGMIQVFAQGATDVDILQFALTLEHLEARMYKDMLATGILAGKEMAYFQNFGDAEAQHEKAVNDTLVKLGATPVAAKASYKFPAFSDRGAILNFAKTAEDIGVTAYQGAAALIKDKGILAAAGSIVQIEARHAALVNLMVAIDPVPDAFTKSANMSEVLAKVGPVLG
jgi:rubrerythrin